MITAHDFPEVYRDLGIDLRNLGCVMLDTEQPDTSWIPDDALYVSPDPKKFWINGKAGQKHVTLRFGLLPQVRQEHVNAVLRGAELPAVLYVNDIEVFESPYADEKYDCIVARVAAPGLQDVHDRLGFLPHLNTFTEYKPHVTLAYTRAGWYKEMIRQQAQAHYESFGQFYNGISVLPIKTTRLNYGKMTA